MDNRKLDWMHLLGLHDAITLIDSERVSLYNDMSRYLNIRNIILSDFDDRSN